MIDDYLFVYGTLRRGATQHSLLNKHAIFLDRATFCGKLYQVEDYPAVISSLDSNDKVYGEVYQLLNAEQAFSVLDNYEEMSYEFPQPHEYVRKKVSVTLQNNFQITAWIYLYNLSVENKALIASGDFLNP